MATKISHCLWFDSQAEEAARFYVSLFKDGKIHRVTHYGSEGFEIHGRPKGSVMTVEFSIGGHRYTALNGGPLFKFNEAFSIMVSCDTQKEIDSYWKKLTASGGQPGPCGWLKDRYGVSWQITPKILDKMIADKDHKKSQRVTKAFLKMKKFDIAKLQQAYNG